jgi:hypothetical protein
MLAGKEPSWNSVGAALRKENREERRRGRRGDKDQRGESGGESV